MTREHYYLCPNCISGAAHRKEPLWVTNLPVDADFLIEEDASCDWCGEDRVQLFAVKTIDDMKGELLK